MTKHRRWAAILAAVTALGFAVRARAKDDSPAVSLEVVILKAERDARPKDALRPWRVKCRVLRGPKAKVPKRELTLLLADPVKTFGVSGESLARRRFELVLSDPLAEPYAGGVFASPVDSGRRRDAVGVDRDPSRDAGWNGVGEAFGTGGLGLRGSSPGNTPEAPARPPKNPRPPARTEKKH